MNESFPWLALDGVISDRIPTSIHRPVSLEVFEGSIIGILGRANTGKTTLLKIAATLLKPTRGAVRILGSNAWTCPEMQRQTYRAQIGMVFQNDALFEHLNVMDNLRFPLTHLEKFAALPEDEANCRIMHMLDTLDIRHAAHLLPMELSGGMKRRVTFARALMVDPQILILDNPTQGLDPVTASTIWQLILGQRLQRATLVVSPDDVLPQLADACYHLE